MKPIQYIASIDWLRVVVHGVIGAVLGAGVGLMMWAFWFHALGPWLMVGMALLCGLLAGILGDRFWDAWLEGAWWNPLNWG